MPLALHSFHPSSFNATGWTLALTPQASLPRRGLPPISAGALFPMDGFSSLASLSLAITLVGVLESISVSKALAIKHKYELL